MKFLRSISTSFYAATIGDKTVENIDENRTSSRKSVVKPPPSPFNVELKVPAIHNIVWGKGIVADGFRSLFTDI